MGGRIQHTLCRRESEPKRSEGRDQRTEIRSQKDRAGVRAGARAGRGARLRVRRGVRTGRRLFPDPVLTPLLTLSLLPAPALPLLRFSDFCPLSSAFRSLSSDLCPLIS